MVTHTRHVTNMNYVVVLGKYGPRDRLLLCRGAPGSVMVTHTRVAWMLSLVLVAYCPLDAF